MNRFFVSPDCISQSRAELPDEVSSQIRKVLRLQEGTVIQILDNQGWVYESMVRYQDEKHLYAEVIQKLPAAGEADVRVTLCISLTQRDKFEWILQKCTEAGAAEIVPMITERTLIRRSADISGKYERWEKILKEAAEQCGRGRIPTLRQPMTFSQAAAYGNSADLALFCWEEEKQKTLRELIEPVRSSAGHISLMIGPEGGFSAEEAEIACHHGWHPVTLGKRIYRMETAAIAAVILTLYETER